jgi:6-phosphogluconolactonase
MTAAIDLRPDASDLAVARWLLGRLARALDRQREQIAISVPGGSTPFPIFAELVAMPLDWRRITVWTGDDRIVAESHPASNIGRIRALFAPLGAEVVALEEHAQPPHFALVWLGMGEDGHVASLFPNTDPQLDEPPVVKRITPDPLPPEAPFDRLTMTLASLLDSEELMFVIRGTTKRALFEAAAAGANDLPVARLLGAAHQPVTCFT